MESKPTNQPSQPVRPGCFRWGIFVFIVAALLVAYLAFHGARQVVASWGPNLVSNPFFKTDSTQTAGLSGPGGTLTPGPGSILPTPNPWNGASRVTILVMGVDYRDWEEQQGPPRSDTMILFTIDPVAKTAGMLSIPRDLWVNIPGMGYNKINTALRFGELYNLPGGGPGLAMKTVEDFLGVPIDFYAQIDFYAFEHFIDDIGGVEVDVPAKISVDPLGPHNTVVLEPGTHLLDGRTALAYARNRYTALDDFDRSERQHQVILAVRQRILSANMLPILVSKSGALYQDLSAGIHTNMTLDQVIQLAWLAQQIPQENIKSVIIGPNQVMDGVSPDGLDIYQPIPSKIRALRDELFASGAADGSTSGDLSPQARMLAEKPGIQVTDRSGSLALGENAQQYLTSLGLEGVTLIKDTQTAGTTQIIDHTGKPYTMEYLFQDLKLSEKEILSKYDPQSPVDIELIVGRDWKKR